MKIKTLNDITRSPEYYIYESESLSLQSNIINGKPDPDIVTHQDRIDCMYDYLQTLNLSIKTENKIYNEIKTVEKYHNDNGSINDTVYDYS